MLLAASAGAPQPLGQMLRASSLEPQIRNWLPAAPQFPLHPVFSLGDCSAFPPMVPCQPTGSLGTGQACVKSPECVRHRQPRVEAFADFNMHLLLFCPCSSRAAREQWGCSKLSNLWPISGNVSVCRALSLGKYCCMLPLPHSPSFFPRSNSKLCGSATEICHGS